jgi:tetratricopeptide (TPR) repeat protein/NAD-dependent dihydropyrimidine dehydrogenase PreA subunit
MLQDLCGWIMKKLGVRPRAFRSRLLLYVPLILALYMFIWPAAYRLGHGLLRQAGWIDSTIPAWHLSTSLTTEHFWKTFPGVLVAIPFLLVCGFATVYFLGAKGFCTYGCPYGGFFAPLDRYAPGRIRVTDACEHCGHCTAVCTSNVRVHEEVREYGMVVDPGCMKCLDCVSVCPNDALYFGFGGPAVAKGAARHQAPRPRYDLTGPEELSCFAFFWLAFVSVRGAYNLVPMLFAAGIAGCLTFVAWKLWRLARDANVSFNRVRLKHQGRVQRGGMVFGAVAAVALALAAQAGATGACRLAGWWHARQVEIDVWGALAGEPPLHGDAAAAAERAVGWYTLAGGMGAGGVGLRGNVSVDARLAELHAALGRVGEAERALRRALDDHGAHEPLCRELAALLRGQGRDAEALELYRATLVEQRDFTLMLDDLVAWCGATGRIEAAIDICRMRRAAFPADQPTLRWLSLLLMESGRVLSERGLADQGRARLEEGMALLRQRVEARPRDPEALINLGRALGGAGQIEEALELTARAHGLAPQRPDVALQYSGMLHALGRGAEALAALGPALERWPDQAELHVQAAAVLRDLGRDAEAKAHLDRVRESMPQPPAAP